MKNNTDKIREKPNSIGICTIAVPIKNTKRRFLLVFTD